MVRKGKDICAASEALDMNQCPRKRVRACSCCSFCARKEPGCLAGAAPAERKAVMFASTCAAGSIVAVSAQAKRKGHGRSVMLSSSHVNPSTRNNCGVK